MTSHCYGSQHLSCEKHDADAPPHVQMMIEKIGRLTAPIALLAFPFYLRGRTPGKEGSHYDPESDLFVPSEAPLVSIPTPKSHTPPVLPCGACHTGMDLLGSC